MLGSPRLTDRAFCGGIYEPIGERWLGTSAASLGNAAKPRQSLHHRRGNNRLRSDRTSLALQTCAGGSRRVEKPPPESTTQLLPASGCASQIRPWTNQKRPVSAGV